MFTARITITVALNPDVIEALEPEDERDGDELHDLVMDTVVNGDLEELLHLVNHDVQPVTVEILDDDS